MYGKHLLIMACSGFLIAAMGPALAADNTAATGQQNNSYENGSNTAQMTTTQTSSTSNAQSEQGQTSQQVTTTNSDQNTTANKTAASQAENAKETQSTMLLRRMYRQLKKQAIEIRLLRQQLAQQQSNARTTQRSGTFSHSSNAVQNPLDQIAHVVVDQFGRVQAIVLDSGAVLAANGASQMARQGAHNNGSRGKATTGATSNAQRTAQTGQRRQAIIIFKPQP